ncbi:hypothetical protein BOX15_Mlig014418g2, partial [Macrostomum lignano]
FQDVRCRQVRRRQICPGAACCPRLAPPAAAAAPVTKLDGPLHHVKFEIHGKVQGVFFRKHTEREARRLGLVGYVLNTEHGTVLGEACGPAPHLEEFKRWLRTKGSPKSRIDKAVFTDEGPSTDCPFADFTISK